ncbi:hypothetical protein ACF8C4_13900 [Myroides odoratimimus]|uniref:hypothetical protein n=1 Tax=Myroides odoratimimus TaxID=76832 RepID=UPI00370AE6A4
MNRFTDIKSFRSYFIEEISLTLNKVGYKYIKTKETFVANIDDHIFQIKVYMYKRSTFVEIETKVYYGNKKIETDLKKIGIKVCDDSIVGGETDFICEYYFKQKYLERYSSLIYELNDTSDNIIHKWLYYYENYLKVFLKEMSDPITLNKIVNQGDIEVVGLNSSYESRVLKFYFVGKNAGLNDDELNKLFILYENNLLVNNSRFLSKFLELKSFISSKIDGAKL